MNPAILILEDDSVQSDMLEEYIESIFPSERLIKIKKINDTIPFSKDYKYL